MNNDNGFDCMDIVVDVDVDVSEQGIISFNYYYLLLRCCFYLGSQQKVIFVEK
jgi:hypothetical protein